MTDKERAIIDLLRTYASGAPPYQSVLMKRAAKTIDELQRMLTDASNKQLERDLRLHDAIRDIGGEE